MFLLSYELMFAPSDLRDIETALGALVSDLAPSDVPVAYALQVFERFATIERLAASAKTLVARRVEAAGSYKQAGCRSTAEQLAKVSGTSNAAAARMLETSKQLEELPVVADAVRAGKLSACATEMIASAATVAPGRAERLVEVAERSTLSDVKREATEVTASAGDREERYRQLRKERSFREWSDIDGSWHFSGQGTVDDGARFRSVMEPLVNQLFEQARADGTREPREAYAYDAFIELTTTERTVDPESKSRPNPRLMALLRLDYTAFVRGDVADGELCEIAGLGPIPVSIARELLGESILKLVITKGVDVMNVTHLGRHPTVAQQVALLWQDPICAAEGCNRVARLQTDHRADWALTYRTELGQLDRLCEHCHDLKTRYGWALVEGTGRRPMVPPDDPRHPRNKPKHEPPGRAA